MSELTFLEIFYPFALLLAAGGFWSVLKLRPELRCAFWFALAFVCGACAFGVEFFRFALPLSAQVLFGSIFYMLMAACLVIGLIARSEHRAPKAVIFSISIISALTVWALSLVGSPVLLRVCLVQIVCGVLLVVALFYMSRQLKTFTDKAVMVVTGFAAVMLMVQPFLVIYLIDLPTSNLDYNSSPLYWSLSFLVMLCSLLIAALLVREYFMVIIEDLKGMADKDTLTDTLNRRGFQNAIAKLIADAGADGGMVAFIMIDIDHFKHVNDTYGHGFGDEVIQGLGNLLKAHKGESGLAARLGGEEFVLAVCVPSLERACETAGQIRERWERYSFCVDGGEVRCTASFGVALHQTDEAPSQTLARADDALYGAKQSGRNIVKSEMDLQVAKLKLAAMHMAQANDGTLDVSAEAKPHKSN